MLNCSNTRIKEEQVKELGILEREAHNKEGKKGSVEMFWLIMIQSSFYHKVRSLKQDYVILDKYK